MKKLFSIFSLGVLLFNSTITSFTYAIDVDEISLLLESFLQNTDINQLEKDKNILQQTNNIILQNFEEETGLDEIEVLTEDERVVVWNKTQKNITVYPTDYSTGITIKDRNLGATKYLGEEGATEDEIIGDYYQWGKNESITTGNFSFYNTTNRDSQRLICDNGYHIPKNNDWKNLVFLYPFNNETNNKFINDLKLPFGGMVNNTDYNGLVFNTYVEKGSWGFFRSSNAWEVDGNADIFVIKDNEIYISSSISPEFNGQSYASRRLGLSVRCFKDNYLETLTLKIGDETILTQFEHGESFNKSLTGQLLSNIDIPEGYHVEWYITGDNNELTGFDFDNEEITTTMTLIGEVVNNNNGIFDLGNGFKRIIRNDIDITIDTNVIQTLERGANSQGDSVSIDNNIRGGANDNEENQYGLNNDGIGRKGPCNNGFHVPSLGEFWQLGSTICLNSDFCNRNLTSENIIYNGQVYLIIYYDPNNDKIGTDLANQIGIPTGPYRTSSKNFIGWGTNSIMGYRYQPLKGNVLCLQNKPYKLNIINKENNELISSTNKIAGLKVEDNNLPEKLIGYTNNYYTKNNENKYEEIDDILELTIKSNIDIYVETLPIIYSINYLDEEGNEVQKSQIFTYNSGANLKLYGGKREGYNFLGWMDEKGNRYMNGSSVLNLTGISGAVLNFTTTWEPIPVIASSAGGGSTINSSKQENKTTEKASEQEHNSANTEDQKTTNTQNNTSSNNETTSENLKQKVFKIQERSLTRGEIAIMTNILLEAYPELVEGKQELDDVTNACSNYVDEQNFTKDEKKAITRLCKLSIMGIHADDNKPLEEFLANDKSTNDEFSKVINRSIETYNEKDLSTIKDALKKLEGDEENVVFGTVYDVFMSIKNIFN